jgi:hypothetical protein
MFTRCESFYRSSRYRLRRDWAFELIDCFMNLGLQRSQEAKAQTFIT